MVFDQGCSSLKIYIVRKGNFNKAPVCQMQRVPAVRQASNAHRLLCEPGAHTASWQGWKEDLSPLGAGGGPRGRQEGKAGTWALAAWA